MSAVEAVAEEPRALQAKAATKAPRWNINRSALYVLEQVFALEKFPSHHMRQRLAADLGVTARQVQQAGRGSRLFPAPRGGEGPRAFPCARGERGGG